MTLLTSPVPLNVLVSLRLPHELRLTPEQFELVCAENREAVLELDTDSHLISPHLAADQTLMPLWHPLTDRLRP